MFIEQSKLIKYNFKQRYTPGDLHLESGEVTEQYSKGNMVAVETDSGKELQNVPVLSQTIFNDYSDINNKNNDLLKNQ